MKSPLQVQILRPRQLRASDWDHWENILDGRPELHSPFLRPAFVRALAAVRDDVRVAVWDEDGEKSLLAFHPRSHGADALGLGIGEWQAIVSNRRTHDWRRLLAACGWRSFRYDHLCHWQAAPGQCCRVGRSPWVDLSGGFQQYLLRRRAMGGQLVAQAGRKARKLQRELGELTLELDGGPEAMDALLQWKQRQHVRTGVPDAFQVPWIVQLLRRVSWQREAAFRGRLSLLRAGGRPVAVLLGVESRGRAHIWYPAYDFELAKYSPGTVMWLRLFEALAAEGVERVDFGPGGQRYKDSLKTDDDHVAWGVVDARRSVAAARRQWSWVRGGLRAAKSRLKSPLRAALSRFRPAPAES